MNVDLLSTVLQGTRPAKTYVHPIMGLTSEKVMAKEVLTRFEDEDGHLCTVGNLFADTTLAPQMRMQLDVLCLRTIFETLAVHPITEHLIFINMNPLTLDYPDFWNHIRQWVWNLSIPPHRIVLEVTEAHSVHGLDTLAAYTQDLRKMGFRIAVDDVGSGAASLTHVARLTPDFIKVDQSLVRHVHKHPFQAALLQALANFTQRMRIGFIAEGIETPEELKALQDAAVPWGQGFLFGKPEPLSLP